VSAPVTDPDAIVALASHEWERLPAAVALARTYPRALVVLTRPELVTEFNCHDCARRPDRLARAGVAPERIRVLPLTAPGTHGEALAVRDFARNAHLGRVVVVTSPYHTRRALATFRHVLKETVAEVGIVAVSEPDPPLHPERWWEAPYEIAYVRYEWAGVFYYWIRYGVPAFG
jgi:uncharacterized SAM-binding protein YcdF (DUF218 family)